LFLELFFEFINDVQSVSCVEKKFRCCPHDLMPVFSLCIFKAKSTLFPVLAMPYSCY